LRSGYASTSTPSNATPHDESNSFVLAQELQPGRWYKRGIIALLHLLHCGPDLVGGPCASRHAARRHDTGTGFRH
jgi:hypothetical protein